MKKSLILLIKTKFIIKQKFETKTFTYSSTLYLLPPGW